MITFFAILILALAYGSHANTDRGQLCPWIQRTASTTVRHGFGAGNFEVFTFAGVTGQVISISVRRTSASMDPMFFLWAPNGATLAFQDDDVDDPFGGPFADPQLNGFVLPQTGTYSIAVADFLGLSTGPLGFTIFLTGSTLCCTGNSRCLGPNTYAHCINNNGTYSYYPTQSCQPGLVCCPSGDDIYCVRPAECPSPLASCSTIGNQKCLSQTTYTTCAESIRGFTAYGVAQACQPGLVCCPDGHNVRCVRPSECPL